MNRALISLFALWVVIAAPAGDCQVSGQNPVRTIDKQELSIEYLAYSFFRTASRVPEVLTGIISAEGIDRITPEIAVLLREMHDIRKLALKARQVCTDLQNADNGMDFAAVMSGGEERELMDQQEAAARILSMLELHDRVALVQYLDERIRPGIGVTRIDWVTMITSEPFPSTMTTKLLQRACDAAAEAEVRVVQKGNPVMGGRSGEPWR